MTGLMIAFLLFDSVSKLVHVLIPGKPPAYSGMMPPAHSDLMLPGVPINCRPPFRDDGARGGGLSEASAGCA